MNQKQPNPPITADHRPAPPPAPPQTQFADSRAEAQIADHLKKMAREIFGDALKSMLHVPGTLRGIEIHLNSLLSVESLKDFAKEANLFGFVIQYEPSKDIWTLVQKGAKM